MRTSPFVILLSVAVLALGGCGETYHEQDVKRITQLRDFHKVDLGVVAPHEFFLNFPEEAQAKAASVELKTLGYDEIEVFWDQVEQSHGLSGSKDVAPLASNIKAIRTELTALATKHGGTYTYWE